MLLTRPNIVVNFIAKFLAAILETPLRNNLESNSRKHHRLRKIFYHNWHKIHLYTAGVRMQNLHFLNLVFATLTASVNGLYPQLFWSAAAPFSKRWLIKTFNVCFIISHLSLLYNSPWIADVLFLLVNLFSYFDFLEKWLDWSCCHFSDVFSMLLLNDFQSFHDIEILFWNVFAFFVL